MQYYLPIEERISNVESKVDEVLLILKHNSSPAKRQMTVPEVATYLGVSKYQIYQLTSKNVIPHEKPCGKIIYFDIDDIDAWLKSGRKLTQSEIASRAAAHVTINKKGNKNRR
ncbi:MAG: helix-turn-helix domain-containing protein [Ignavibacteria bacterium]|jgi:excisionase family DNA binding protein|nr:helix-turn-helix domain-containing protein [Ignavibacteria bacterium]